MMARATTATNQICWTKFANVVCLKTRKNFKTAALTIEFISFKIFQANYLSGAHK